MSGDPNVNDFARVIRIIDYLYSLPEKGRVEITGVPAGPVKPDQILHLKCRVEAPPDFVRPYRVKWFLSRTGGRDASPIPLLPEAKSNIMVTSLKLAGAEEELRETDCTVRVEVADATGRPIGSAGAALRIAGMEREPSAPVTEGVAVMMAMPHSKPVGRGRGFMSGAGTVTYTFHPPVAQYAHPFSEARPEIWIAWKEFPEKAGAEIKGRISGGIPAYEKEFSGAVTGAESFEKAPHGLGHKFYNRGVGHKGRFFTFELPIERGYGGEFRIEGALYAYKIKPNTRSDWRGQPLLRKKPFTITLQYFPPPSPKSTGYYNIFSTGRAAGSMTLVGVQRGKRVAEIRVGGVSYFSILNAGKGRRGGGLQGSISFVVPFPSAPIGKAVVTFADFGAKQTAQVDLKLKRTSERVAVDQASLAKLRAAINKSMRGGDRELPWVASGWWSTAGQYTARSGDIIDPAAWSQAVAKYTTFVERAVARIGDPDWPGHRWQIPPGPRRIKQARISQNYARRRFFINMCSAASTAARGGLIEAALLYAGKAESLLRQLPPDEVKANTSLLVRAFRDSAQEMFHFRGDLGASRSLWRKAESLRNEIARADGRRFNPRRFPFQTDPEFESVR